MVKSDSEFEAKTSDSACCGAAQERSARSEVINVMQGFSKALPLYVWLVALPQLISRICHPHLETQRITQHILTRVTSTYPHQACFSSFPMDRQAFPYLYPWGPEALDNLYLGHPFTAHAKQGCLTTTHYLSRGTGRLTPVNLDRATGARHDVVLVGVLQRSGGSTVMGI